eukprot:362193-Chlamydomonas_euryale.AAC.4
MSVRKHASEGVCEREAQVCRDLSTVFVAASQHAFMRPHPPVRPDRFNPPGRPRSGRQFPRSFTSMSDSVTSSSPSRSAGVSHTMGSERCAPRRGALYASLSNAQLSCWPRLEVWNGYGPGVVGREQAHCLDCSAPSSAAGDARERKGWDWTIPSSNLGMNDFWGLATAVHGPLASPCSSVLTRPRLSSKSAWPFALFSPPLPFPPPRMIPLL